MRHRSGRSARHEDRADSESICGIRIYTGSASCPVLRVRLVLIDLGSDVGLISLYLSLELKASNPLAVYDTGSAMCPISWATLSEA